MFLRSRSYCKSENKNHKYLSYELANSSACWSTILSSFVVKGLAEGNIKPLIFVKWPSCGDVISHAGKGSACWSTILSSSFVTGLTELKTNP